MSWVACGPALEPTAATEPPNIVWILAEDASVHHFELYGAQAGQTPRLVQLAQQGLLFEHAFSCSPVCSVARTTLMTGQFAPRIGFQYHRQQALAELPAGEHLFPYWLRQAGYYTSNRAKKDYNVVESTNDDESVWDESSPRASWRNRPDPSMPFFHMETITLSHESSLHVDAETLAKAIPKDSNGTIKVHPFLPDTSLMRQTQARYFQRIEAVDREVGRIIDDLTADQLLDNTIVFFFGDHGGVLPRSKGYLYETGLHVPLVIAAGRDAQHLLPQPKGTRAAGFVSFVDFAPTVLNLAGIDQAQHFDGQSFLGTNVSAEGLNRRDTAWGYADRFDEKIEMVRSLRRGRYKYLRSYENFYPDSLQNNYRYRMLAYAQWRDLEAEGSLSDNQSAFFRSKPPEQLFDLETDPYETVNLASQPEYQTVLKELRQQLRSHLKQLPDLSFYPESEILRRALPHGATFGQQHADEIARLIDTADMALLPPPQALPRLRTALQDASPWVRYWACIACTSLGRPARKLIPELESCLSDAEPLVRLRAAECLAVLDDRDVHDHLQHLVENSTSPSEVLIELNTIVFLRDHLGADYSDFAQWKISATSSEVERRVNYLTRPPHGKP